MSRQDVSMGKVLDSASIRKSRGAGMLLLDIGSPYPFGGRNGNNVTARVRRVHHPSSSRGNHRVRPP